MRKKVFGRKFKRDANERKALLKGLMTDLVLKESIQTTEEKAKAIKGQIEKLVTKAKRKGQEAESLLQPYLSVDAYKKVIRDLAKRFAGRPGGYVRIVKLGQRFGDNARMVIIEWVEKQSIANGKELMAEEGKNVEKREKKKEGKVVKKTVAKSVKKEIKPKTKKTK